MRWRWVSGVFVQGTILEKLEISPSDFCLADLRLVVYAAGMIPVGQIWRAGDFCVEWLLAAEESRLKIDYECLLLFCKIGVSEWIKRRLLLRVFFFFFFGFSLKQRCRFWKRLIIQLGPEVFLPFSLQSLYIFDFTIFIQLCFKFFNFLLNLIPK